MNNSEFRNVVRDLLTDAWGEKAYPPAQLQKLWQIVAPITVQEFKMGLETLSMSCNRAPALGQIRAACLPAIMKAQHSAVEARIKQLEGGRACPDCNNGGYVYVIPYDNPTEEGVFLCTCKATDIRGFLPNHGLTHWKPELEHKYFVRKFTGPAWLEAERLQAEAFKKWHKPKKEKRDDRIQEPTQEPRTEERDGQTRQGHGGPHASPESDGGELQPDWEEVRDHDFARGEGVPW